MDEILNSRTLPEDGLLPVQVAPFGEFKGVKNKADGTSEPFVQNLDRAAFDRILNAWRSKGAPELLVDADHDSANGGSTKAYAWASNLRVEADGLYADFKFTDEGAKAVNAREYRFVSPVFSLYEDGEIADLTSIALTNCPNLPVSFVLNADQKKHPIRVRFVGDQPKIGAKWDPKKKDYAHKLHPIATNTNPTRKDNPNMEKILSALGLGPDASEDDAVAAIEAMKQENSDAKAAALNSEAEKFADEHKDRIENRQAMIDLYVKNGKEVAESFLAAFKAPEKKAETPVQTVLNSTTVATPDKPSALRDGLAKCKNAKERAAYVTAHAREFAAETLN